MWASFNYLGRCVCHWLLLAVPPVSASCCSITLYIKRISPSLFPLQIRDYVNSLEAHLAEAHRQAGRLLRKEADLGAALAEFGAAAEALGKQDDVGPLRGAFGALYGRAGEVAALSKARSEAMAAEFQVCGGHGAGDWDWVGFRVKQKGDTRWRS